MKMYLAGAALAASLALGACTATQDLANACKGAAGALATAADLKAKGSLTAPQVASITTAANLINPICASPVPPVTINAAVGVVTAEVSVITPIITGVK